MDKRNVYIYGVNKNSITENMQLQKTEIANYEQSAFYVTTPTLVKINDNLFLVLWQEYNPIKKTWNPIKYTYVDGTGNVMSKVNQLHPFFMLSETQPVVADDRVI